MATISVSFDLTDAVASDIYSITLKRDPDAEFGIACEVHHQIRDTGDVVRETHTVPVALTQAQTTVIENFVTNTVLPAVNAARGFGE